MIHRLYDAMRNIVLKINGTAIVFYRKNGTNNFKLYIIMYSIILLVFYEENSMRKFQAIHNQTKSVLADECVAL